MQKFSTIAAIMLLASTHPATAVVTEADLTGHPGLMTAGFGGLSGVFSGTTLFAATPEEASLTAPNDLFADGGVLSTNFDLDPISNSCAGPVFAFGFTGGIADLALGGVSGTLRITVDGQVFDKAVPADLDTTFGFLSDVGFTTASIEVLDYDLNATSIAFVGLQDMSASATPIPLPAGVLLLGTAVAALGLRRRSQGD